jgi:hypothetical protein
MRFFVLAALFLFVSGSLYSQTNPRIQRIDSSVSAIAEQVSFSPERARNLVMKKSFLPLGKEGIWQRQKPKVDNNLQWYFHYLFFLIVFFALLKQFYPRYLQDLFRVFLRTSLKANQIKEQLVSSVWQSFLFNILFFFSAGFYLFLLLKYFHLSADKPAASMLALCTGMLAGLYSIKMLFLRITGWLFHVSQPAETYIFVVFLINKVLGILFLPFIIIIAFAPAEMAALSIRTSFVIIAALFIYRSLLGLQAGSSISKVSKFHFLLFILSIEIIPLLAIFRVFLDVL